MRSFDIENPFTKDEIKNKALKTSKAEARIFWTFTIFFFFVLTAGELFGNISLALQIVMILFVSLVMGVTLFYSGANNTEEFCNGLKLKELKSSNKTVEKYILKVAKLERELIYLEYNELVNFAKKEKNKKQLDEVYER